MICSSCRLPIHPHQAEEDGVIVIRQGGDRRHDPACGECPPRIEATIVGRGRPEVPNPPLVTITR
jgi:hypothetical protein